MSSKKKLTKRKNDLSRYLLNTGVSTNNHKKDPTDSIQHDESAGFKSIPTNAINLNPADSNELKAVSHQFKSPIISLIGHVDAGKTSLIDVIRKTNKQKDEAGGITQSIGSYFVRIEDIAEVTKNIKGKFSVEHDIPGFIIIDTPGHEAFSSMRDRGSSLCDIAILVVDINKGIQPQTQESIELLKSKKIPFIIAATKLDMVEDWETSNEINLRKSMKVQSEVARNSLYVKIEDLKYEFEKLEIKTEFYFSNEKNLKSVYSIVPISSKTKEGLSDLLSLIVFITQNCMTKKISYKDKFEATIMEYNLDKDGHNIDIILTNGTIRKGDKIIVITNDEPKICTIRNIYKQTYNSNKKKTELISHEEIVGSCGAKIIGSNLDGCISGSSIFQIKGDDDIPYQLEHAKEEYKRFWKSFSWSNQGVYLIAPKIGEFEAAYNICKSGSIPILKGEISNLTKKTLDRYSSMLEDEKNDEFRILLNFSKPNKKESLDFAKGSKDYEEMDDGSIHSKSHNILVLQHDVIYQLVDLYKRKLDSIVEERKSKLTKKGEIAFPCKLQILNNHVYRKGGTNGDDFVFGVKVRKGILKMGTPLRIDNDHLSILGSVTSIKKNDKNIDEAKTDEEVCIKITNDKCLLYGRQFDHKNTIYTSLTRDIIEIMKKDFRKDIPIDDWQLVKEIIEKFNIKK